MSRELHSKAYAGHGQVTKLEDVRLHAERDVAFTRFLWQVAAVAVHVSAIQQIREAPSINREVDGSETVDVR